MHSIARDLYASTADTDFRDRITKGGKTFPFDVNAYTTIQNESRIVGMVMAWAVVTLESLANHQLAATLNNKVLATMAIEYPALVTDKLKLSRSARSELAKKLIILTDGIPTPVIELADKLADKRNLIVHDKPFRMIDRGDGDIDVDWFRARGDAESPTVRYGDLTAFYKDCDSIKDCVLNASAESIDCEINFYSLLGG